ncbi:MAG: bifunctional tRNA (5-methylaminomethyl-2-thiouridine)(34)-methyltransferase MnmD/FAD-dependent 5-carboxymethylaminomethyl-2-thiouridine(34) oxidoreductase MnmC [Endozoicomonas sp.]
MTESHNKRQTSDEVTGSNQRKSSITSASIDWRSDGHPVSSKYGDIYYSTASGIEEIRHTFIQHNQLPQRFQALATGDLFSIGETGFGTGLNFLCTWKLFEEQAAPGTRLRFISTEKYPLSQQDLARALALWPEFEHYSKQLLGTYRTATPGHQHFIFDDGRVCLTLLIGDVLATLPDLEGKVDAWFLDGFNPSKNPDMWQPELFRTMAGKSHPGTSYATFTAARRVRDGLSEAGFSVVKTPGFGKKREMIKGILKYPAPEHHDRPLWYQKPDQTVEGNREAVVIGAGLAGASTAWSLAIRGWKVRLIDRHNGMAQEASGNPQGILYAKLSANETSLSRFILQGYQYSINLLRQVSEAADNLWHPCGVIQLSTTDKVRARHQELAKTFPDEILRLESSETLSAIVGIPVNHDGLFFPEAGWVNPPGLCKTLAAHPNIQLETGIEVKGLEKIDDDWLIKTADGEYCRTKTVILAGGTSSNKLEPFNHLPLKAIRGQISEISVTDESSKLKSCVCADGYAAPAFDGRHTIGATFDFGDSSQEVSSESHEQNLSMQAQWLPGLFEAFSGSQARVTGGRVGFRCTTPDYLPVVGAAVDPEQFAKDFAMLRKNVKYSFAQTPAYLQGLYINAGHGSRGLITCPLSGEILASMISNEPSPVPGSLLDQLNPTRFLVRALARNML